MWKLSSIYNHSHNFWSYRLQISFQHLFQIHIWPKNSSIQVLFVDVCDTVKSLIWLTATCTQCSCNTLGFECEEKKASSCSRCWKHHNTSALNSYLILCSQCLRTGSQQPTSTPKNQQVLIRKLRQRFFTTTCVTALFTSLFWKVPSFSLRVRRTLWAFSHDSYQTTKQKTQSKQYISTQI